MTNPIIKQFTDFPNEKYNSSVLTREINDAITSAELLYIQQNSDVELHFDTDPSVLDEGEIDNIVSNHDGADYSVPPWVHISEAETSDDSGDEVVRVHLDDIMPSPGDYILFAYQELATTATDGTHIAKGRLHVTKNGVKVERAEAHNDQNLFQPMSVAFPFNVLAGDVFSFELTFERQGAGTGNPARVQRARLSMKKAP
jgi:hypothetical protein